MYASLLFIHSWTRWAVLLAGLCLLGLCLRGWVRGRLWGGYENGLWWAFGQLLGYQLLFGIAVYLVGSPYLRVLIAEPAVAMQNFNVFFFALLHPLGMFLNGCLFFAAENIFLRRRGTPQTRHRIALLILLLVFTGIAVLVPWPWLTHGRPWIRATF